MANLFFAGICDFTSRDRRGEEQEIYNDANPSRIDGIKTTLLDIINFTVGNSIHLIILAILFASLSISKSYLDSSGKLRWSRFTVDETIEQQRRLEQDIDEVNQYILSDLRIQTSLSVNLTKDQVSSSIKKFGRNKKRRKVVTIKYDDLVDGIHLNHDIETRIFTKLVSTVKYYRSQI